MMSPEGDGASTDDESMDIESTWHNSSVGSFTVTVHADQPQTVSTAPPAASTLLFDSSSIADDESNNGDGESSRTATAFPSTAIAQPVTLRMPSLDEESGRFVVEGVTTTADVVRMYEIRSKGLVERSPWLLKAFAEMPGLHMSDSVSKLCLLCQAHFNLRTRRHHCRMCGLLVCAACTLHKTVLPPKFMWHSSPQRTCNLCHSLCQWLSAPSTPKQNREEEVEEDADGELEKGEWEVDGQQAASSRQQKKLAPTHLQFVGMVGNVV